ncbi:hypothetical protein HDU76_010858 [Blyttiomyces sp. JEL0837]|nr:hypothetical protein HDU76_010858 [Blyttiomyces sp. JEL0837]
MMEEGDNGEWEEETSYLVLDLGPEVPADAIKSAVKSFEGLSLIGLESPNPMLRIGNMIFKGSFDSTLGTDMVFATSASRTKAKADAPTAPRYGLAHAIYNKETAGGNASLTFMGQSNIRIKFTRVKVDLKSEQQADDKMETEEAQTTG